MAREYKVTASEAFMLFNLVDSQCKSYHNWIASAIEAGKFEYAQKLTADLRDHQRLYAKLNVPAHDMIDEMTEKAKRDREMPPREMRVSAEDGDERLPSAGLAG